jgi:starch synthase
MALAAHLGERAAYTQTRRVVKAGSPMEIAFITTELSPFAKVGGLADVSAALTKALRVLGHAVTVVMPRLPPLEAQGLLLARRLTPLRFTLGEVAIEATLLDGRLASQVDLVVVDVPGLFDRQGVYGEGGRDYPDNALRFATFSRAAAELVRQRTASGRAVDVVHCNDWATALVPTYLRALAAETPSVAATRTVLTIHNVAYQGRFGADQRGALGLEPGAGLSFLRQGIATADAVTTVSPTYAREIQTPEFGAGVDGLLRERGESLIGIANGVDYSVWNPATDSFLAARYDAEDVTNKLRCKGALQSELGMPVDAAVPLVASVGRMVEQKGTDLVAAATGKLLRDTEAQIVIAGDGAGALVSAVEEAVAKSQGRAVLARAAGESVVHRIFAGADFILVPSRYEPCGLVQMYAHRYGALPVARATGGLVDTIVDCDGKLETGTGFLFDEPTSDALVAATERAIAARALPRWPALVRRVMKLDRGWEGPARRYEQVYRSVAAK